MKNFQWKKLLPHVIAVVAFIVVALVYCKPTLEGKVLQQSDVTLWKTMAQNSFEYQKNMAIFLCGQTAFSAVCLPSRSPV
jgi:hypothetical protein